MMKLFHKRTEWSLSSKWVLLFVIAEVVLSLLVVYKIKYTEIDWVAYMEEVEGFLLGERDYTKLRGNTGPLVYPAGFLYVFAALRWLTENGVNIFKAQLIFVAVYLVNLVSVLRLYTRGSDVPLMLAGFLVLSKRIHSIFMLRMFNDCIAVLLGYLAVNRFTKGQFRVGCVLYSVGVSVKMNMFLLAPGILLILLMGTGFAETVVCLSICAAVQLVLGYPFLSTHPAEYLSRSFELGRVFTYQWTVNLKFLPEHVFVDKRLSVLLLVLTIAGYALFTRKWASDSQRSINNRTVSSVTTSSMSSGEAQSADKGPGGDGRVVSRSIIGLGNLHPDFVTTVIFTSTFIGVAFARSLHYQFYCWYFHMLPYLLHRASDRIPLAAKLAVLVAIEVCFNVYPSTAWSSALLQVCHAIVLVGLYCAPTPCPLSGATASSSSKEHQQLQQSEKEKHKAQ